MTWPGCRSATSVAELPYDISGYENAGSPLRKALGIEIVTDQEGSGIEGSGDVMFDGSALDADGAIDSTGTGSLAFDVSALSGSGFQPNAGPGSISFVVSALAAAGSVPLAGPGSVTFATWGFLATGGIGMAVSDLLAKCELADFSNMQIASLG
jgi:hypothetical protein